MEGRRKEAGGGTGGMEGKSKGGIADEWDGGRL